MSDVIVIGGGIAGVSAAARLSAHATVTLIEGEDSLGYHASGRSAALFEENYGLPSVITLNHASAAFHQPYLSPRGFLLVGRAGEDEAFEKAFVLDLFKSSSNSNNQYEKFFIIWWK